MRSEVLGRGAEEKVVRAPVGNADMCQRLKHKSSNVCSTRKINAVNCLFESLRCTMPLCTSSARTVGHVIQMGREVMISRHALLRKVPGQEND